MNMRMTDDASEAGARQWLWTPVMKHTRSLVHKFMCWTGLSSLTSEDDWTCLCRRIRSKNNGEVRIKRVDHDTDKFRVANLLHLSKINGYKTDVNDERIVIIKWQGKGGIQ